MIPQEEKWGKSAGRKWANETKRESFISVRQEEGTVFEQQMHSSRERRLNQGLEAPASFYSQVSLYEIFSRPYLYWLGEKSIRVICRDLHTKS